MRKILGALAAVLTVSYSLAIADGRVDYLREVKPILAARCYGCHGALEQKAKLRLDAASLMIRGGRSGPAISPGKSGASLLMQHVTAANGARRMPPESEGEGLKEREIALLRTWIDQGARAPADDKPEADPKDHWAFRAPVRPPTPPVQNSAALKNPIDAFIEAELETRGLVAQCDAKPQVWLRRVYLDLIGLPPTREEIRAFVADPAPDKYEKVADHLLASKHYGERWGRHFMDIWRYSDWWGLGAEVRNSQKHIWHWRDWIVESLSVDKGYDHMLREMLAADEFYPNDLDKLRATGFLVRPYFIFNRNTWMEEVIEHTSKAFLGLTINCSRCHDHKYDPIRQTDYYRFRAFFEPYQVRTDQLPGETDYQKDGLPRIFDCNLTAPTHLFDRGDDRQPRKDQVIEPGVPALLSFGDLKIEPVSLPPESHSPGSRPFVLENHLRDAERQIAAAKHELEKAKHALAEAAAKPLTAEQARAALALAEKMLAVAELQPQVLRASAAADRARGFSAVNAKDLARQAARTERQAALAKAEEDLARSQLDWLRADPAKRAELDQKRTAARSAVETARKALAAPGETYTSLRGSLKTPENNLETMESRQKAYPTSSSGRRTALAKWLTDPRHPLPARVAVNQVWARHFGKPLVATVFDFGRKGSPPTHPALLDWLAVELRDHGWSLKHLHRLIVTSAAYRRTSSASGAVAVNLEKDQENRFYWRMNPVRMEAQAVRDSLLYLAGELDLTMGGPSIPVADEAARRRSLYYVHSHNDHQKFLSMFDDASVLECYRRAESIVPQQALALENSKLTLEAAAKIAARLTEKHPSAWDADFVQAAFETVMATPPTTEERTECEVALKKLTELLSRQKQGDASGRARVTLVHALLNHNDFITVR